MHETQQKILRLCQTQDISKMSYGQIGAAIGVSHPQKVKHHLEQLKKKKLIDVSGIRNVVSLTKAQLKAPDVIINVPILGEANAGKATLIAEEIVHGYLSLSKSILKKYSNIFALKVVGNSMNNAKGMHPTGIQNGDYVIVDSNNKYPHDGDYVVSIIEGCANIKRFYRDEENERIVLLSESKDREEYPPIFVHQNDFISYLVSGVVIQVVKKFVPRTQ